jgi:CRISPR-associated protein Csx16
MAGRRIFVTQHPGTAEWARLAGYGNCEFVSHLDPETVDAGDMVMGTLPVHLAARIIVRGGVFCSLVLDVPAEERGRDRSATEIAEAGARLEPLIVLAASREPRRRSWLSSIAACAGIAVAAFAACWRYRRTADASAPTTWPPPDMMQPDRKSL